MSNNANPDDTSVQSVFSLDVNRKPDVSAPMGNHYVDDSNIDSQSSLITDSFATTHIKLRGLFFFASTTISTIVWAKTMHYFSQPNRLTLHIVELLNIAPETYLKIVPLGTFPVFFACIFVFAKLFIVKDSLFFPCPPDQGA